jgi:hypothetical protein
MKLTKKKSAMALIFTPNAVYQSIPGVGSEIFEGREAIQKYWYDVTRDYEPKGNHMITLVETNVLTFVKSGLVSKNVEYWNIIPGVHAPPKGWGS